MSREVKRVPLGFDWPMHKVWEGYINPHYQECPDCRGNGSTKSHEALDQIVGLLMLAGADSIHSEKPPHSYLQSIGIENVGVSFYELSTGLAGRSPGILGHDAIDRWSAIRAIIKAAKLPKDWGTCPTCKGDGINPQAKVAYEAWEKIEPPSGEGWQMWETTSEGSPISPVFVTPEELAQWLADTKASTFGREKADYKAWLAMIKKGWAISAISVGGQLMSGVQFIAKNKEES